MIEITSILSKKSLLTSLFITLFSSLLIGQVITVNTSYTKEQLVKDIFVGNSLIHIDESSIQINGWTFDDSDKSYGYFDRGTSNFIIDKGILLSSGKLIDAPGPNFGISSRTDENWRGDADLERALRINNTTDATSIEFDFSSTTINEISFDYLFASEQYLRIDDRGNCGYTDGFAFLIKKAGTTEAYRNLAVLPNTTTPVSVNTVYGTGGKCSPINPQYFDQFNPTNSPISFNGNTKLLTASTTIVPGEKYHLKIVIADQGNGQYDSGVFLKANSFVGTKKLGDDITLCPASIDIVDATMPDAVAYKWLKDGTEIIGETNAQLTVREAGYYEVEIEFINGGKLKGYINVYMIKSPTIVNRNFNICNDLLNGNITVNLLNYVNLIVDDIDRNTNVKFFTNIVDAQANSGNEITTLELHSSADSKTVYIRVESGSCPPIIEAITFYTNGLSQYNFVEEEICNATLAPSVGIVLSDYLAELTSNIEGNVTYYLTENDAKTKQNAISPNQTINADKTFYVRFKQVNFCENVAPIYFKYKEAKKSDVLKDVTICKDSFTTLDAGSGFDSYLWDFNNATTSSISNIPVGVYHVRLETNGCFYTQEVKVIAAEDPIIEAIEIQGSTVTIITSGANPPYLYSLNNGPFQPSNVFTNVTLGQHKVRVQSSLNCTPVTKEFSLIKLINFFSPNGDGKNDTLDYSQLRNKKNTKFVVYTRTGRLVFEGSEANNFIWDGKVNGFNLPSDSYWYTLEWTEDNASELQKYTGWLLLKRE